MAGNAFQVFGTWQNVFGNFRTLSPSDYIVIHNYTFTHAFRIWYPDSCICIHDYHLSLTVLLSFWLHGILNRYGPFWICTTLIFVAASIGTFVTYLEHKLQNKEWEYDINLVTWSAGLFYGYVTIVPLGLYILLKYFSAPSGLVQLWCLYGYSLFIFIPASVSFS